MEGLLDSKIRALKNVAKMYQGFVVKKDSHYQYRLDAIYLQIEVLEELRDGKHEIVNNWMECFHEDSAEIESKQNVTKGENA